MAGIPREAGALTPAAAAGPATVDPAYWNRVEAAALALASAWYSMHVDVPWTEDQVQHVIASARRLVDGIDAARRAG